jgi:hypothetical protein
MGNGENGRPTTFDTNRKLETKRNQRYIVKDRGISV